MRGLLGDDAGATGGKVARYGGAKGAGSFAALRMTVETDSGKSNDKCKIKSNDKGNGEIQGSLHCAPDVTPSGASVEMTFL